MKLQDFRLVHRLRVRWAEVDMQKIVSILFNAVNSIKHLLGGEFWMFDAGEGTVRQSTFGRSCVDVAK